MATNFGDTLMDGAIAPSVAVQAPVEDNSGAVLARGFAPAAEAIGGVIGSIFKSNQQDATAKILTGYENDLLDLADAVDQGAMDTNEAMIRARNLRRQYLANSPALQTDFDKIWTNFATSNGLGNVVVSGTIDQQIQDERYKKAAEMGYTPQQYEEFQAVSNQATALNNQLEIIKAQGGIVTETMKNQSIQVMVGLADKAFPAAQAQINEAMALIEANPSQKAQIAAETIQEIKSSVAQLGHMTGGVGAEYITTPINDLLTTFEGWANGSVENAVLEGSIKMTQSKYDAMYANDPVLGPVIAQSKLLNELGLSSSPLAVNIFDPDIIRRLKEVSDDSYTLNILGQQPGDQKIVQAMNEAVTLNLTDAAQQEIAEVYADIIDGAYVHERSTDDPLGYKNTVEALGSPEATEFFKNNTIPSRHADKFVDIISANYNEALLPAISDYWTTSTIQVPAGFGQGPSSMQVVPSEVFDPVWNGSVVEFVPKEQYANNEGIMTMAQDINTGSSSIGVPLNTLIRAISNVTGQDAKTVWETQFAGRVFGLGEEGEGGNSASAPLAQTPPVSSFANLEQGITSPEQMNTNPSELTLEDFNPDPEIAFEQAKRVVTNTSASNPTGVLNATNPVAFAQAFIGMREDKFEDQQVLSSFIKKAAGISINPAQTAWCAAFVDAILRTSGQGEGTGKLNARSYLNWGTAVDEPQEGDVVVMWRDNPNSWKGHVGFYAGKTADGKIRVLGGNQSNSVSIADYNADTVLGYRRAN